MTPRERTEEMFRQFDAGQLAELDQETYADFRDAIERAIVADRAERTITDIPKVSADERYAMLAHHAMAVECERDAARASEKAMRDRVKRIERIVSQAYVRHAADKVFGAEYVRAALSGPASPATCEHCGRSEPHARFGRTACEYGDSVEHDARPAESPASPAFEHDEACTPNDCVCTPIAKDAPPAEAQPTKRPWETECPVCGANSCRHRTHTISPAEAQPQATVTSRNGFPPARGPECVELNFSGNHAQCPPSDHSSSRNRDKAGGGK